jgi:hypothetical protein
MSHTYQANLSQQHISQQVRIVAANLNDQMAQRNATREKNFQTHAIQNVVIGGLLILMLIVIWLRLIMRLTGRLSMLTSALDGLSEGVLTPKSLPDVQKEAVCWVIWRVPCLPFARPVWRTAKRSMILVSA